MKNDNIRTKKKVEKKQQMLEKITTTTNHCRQKQNFDPNPLKVQILQLTSITLRKNIFLMYIWQPIYLLKSEHPT